MYIHNTTICRNIVNNNEDFNERTITVLYKNIPLTLYSRKGSERVNVGYVWEVSWRRKQTATYWPKVSLTIAALLSHLGWAAQPWVTEGPSPLSAAGSQFGILSPTDSNCDCNWTDSNWRTPASCGRTHLYRIQPRPQVKMIFRYLRPDAPVSLLFCLFTQGHLLIDGSVEGQYVIIRWN